jgi:tetratricopeptide (TPR) repeat protein
MVGALRKQGEWNGMGRLPQVEGSGRASARATICLNMIVKDEAHVVARCLASVRPFITHWVVVDTGSSDGTQAIVRAALEGIPGELHQRPWRDFGHNRSEALELARGKADYVLTMDADDFFESPAAWQWPELVADAYDIACHRNGTTYTSRLLVSNRKSWRYIGVLHEYVDCGEPCEVQLLPGAWIERPAEGARSRDPDTYRKDAASLERALRDEPDNARYAFYLAQSWRDAGDAKKALAAYRRRIAMGGWDQEIWYSLYQVGRLAEVLDASPAEVRDAYLAAFQFRPSRAEPLYELARYYRGRQEWWLAYLFAQAAAEGALPEDALFVDETVYRWRALDELATSAYWVAAYAVGRRTVAKLLLEGWAPRADLARIEDNLRWYPPELALAA